MIVIKWAWRHGVLDADDFGSIDEAVQAASWASGAGEESLESIEVIHDDGRSEVLGDVGERMRVIEQAEEDERKKYPPPVARIDLRSPNGEWALFRTHAVREDADRDAAELVETFGPDRVRVRPVG